MLQAVSGANRGIGLELVYNILKRQPDAVIFAGARDPSSAKELKELASENPNVHLIKVIADDEESNKQAVEKIKKVTDRLDVVVANAGKSMYSLATPCSHRVFHRYRQRPSGSSDS